MVLLCMDRSPRAVDSGLPEFDILQAVVGGRLAVKVVAVLQRDFGVVGNDFVVAVGLQEEDVLERDTRKMLEARARLDRVVQVELALVDKDVDRS